ncbi:haemagglutination activity domain protein [Coleofasciculus chthonoplastes PCC 7420]|uniref:Haemagglutination activity domain protein n=1 Tax=Coleofasciculus chthonoplastes PCC 7420 TaxID=118168 RepID=B4VPE9_9CYAN|nr:haemagglutination activity domain protein [Coleofasciculus chthonoplastes PCC 7420]
MASLVGAETLAQSIIPASDGTGTIIDQQGNTYTINGGSLSSDEANLFHSFQEFGLDAGEIANFLANPHLNNIFGRVMGGNPSLINGLIQVTGGNANLYLMNPAGIVFGQNAQLNVPADFIATTATGIGFGENLWFNAFGTNEYQQFVGNPQQFIFDVSQPGSIVNSGNLAVFPGQSLTLLGGTVINTGELTAPGGRITISAVSGSHRVKISQPGQLLSLEVEPLVNSSGEVIPFTPLDLAELLTGTEENLETCVEVDSAETVKLTDSDLILPNQPDVTIISGTIDVSQLGNSGTPMGAHVYEGAHVYAPLHAPSSATGGEINVIGKTVGLISANIDASGTNGGGTVRIGGDYQGAGIIPNADVTLVNENSTIQADALTAGDGGTVMIWADKQTVFYGNISTRGGLNSGDGGFVEISSQEKLAFDGVVDVNAIAGEAGQLLLDPTSVIIGTSGTNDTALNDNQILSGDGSGSFLISANSLLTALNSGDVLIAASKNIDIISDINSSSSNNLTFEAAFINLDASIGLNGGNLTFEAPVILRSSQTLSTGSTVGGDITFNSSLHAFNPGTDTLTLEAGTGNITFNGAVGGALPYNVAVLLDDPVGYWRLDEEGETAFDSSGNNIDGTYFGGVNRNQEGALVDDANPAPFFDGTTGYVEIPDSDFIDFGTNEDFTITAWIKASPEQLDTVAGDKDVIEKWSGGEPYPYVIRYFYRSGKILAARYNGFPANPNNPVVSSTVSIDDGQFHHIAFIKEGSTLSLYVDGILQDTNTDTINSPTQNNSPLFLARRGGNAFDNFFRGSIDEVAIYDSALSPDEVAAQYTTGAGTATSRQIGGLTVNNATNITANDTITANSIDLTASQDITTQSLDTSSSSGDGGSITLNAENNIQVTSINTQGGSNGTGGNVDITAGRFIQITDTFIDQNGKNVSISTAGGNGGGVITIQHGGQGLIPFNVGDASINGTAGSIASGESNLQPFQSFPDNQTEGNIRIITDKFITGSCPPDCLDTEQSEIDESEDITEEVVIDTSPVFNPIAETETAFTNEYEEYWGLSETPIITLAQAQRTLQRIEQATGVKPALIYAVFVPGNGVGDDGGRVEVETRKRRGSQREAQRFAEGVGGWDEMFLAQEVWEDGNQLELILVTAEGEPMRFVVPGASRKRVMETLQTFRRAVTDTRIPRPYLPSAQQLYQWLIAPLEEELQDREINNLAFIMDQGLRSLPVAALHDGNGFIVERYSIGFMPSLSLTDTRYVDVRDLQVLAMGASEFTEQNPLPAVPVELSAIADKLWQGESFLNSTFTPANLKAARADQPFGIVHLATHGEFKPGKPENSYIQFWNTRLSLDQIRQLGLHNPPVELMVLSACRTALGNQEAELGFTGLAVQAGVKSALGSLWYVSDEGTLGLMTTFYQNLKQVPIKAEALRETQLAMIQGQVKIENGQLITPNSTIDLPEELAGIEDKALTHPYFWSAFTLVGSPW